MTQDKNFDLDERLDHYLVKEGFFQSRDRAKEAIKSGQVEVGGKIIRKPAFSVASGLNVKILKADFSYVSRAALKLKAAVEDFQVPVADRVCLDIGVATGGFSDYLLQAGARKVYGVDVGDGQIVPKISSNPRFIFRNRTDARTLRPADFAESLDLIVIDVSFISIVKFFEALIELSASSTDLIALIKPQFEMGLGKSNRLGNQSQVQKILDQIKVQAQENGFKVIQEMPSPILGKEGTQEYLWLMRKSS
jgi:23S rRNA (cytidine1920-2'-O)/16S rRNA (cytidine1409-2'-O)-methyltransferase